MTAANKPASSVRWWLLGAVFIVALAAFFVRMGAWQLQRLEDRRAANARLIARLEAPPLVITGEPLDPEAVDLRRATVRGRFDYEQEIVLRNRTWNELPGVHVLVPLRIAGSDAAILVDRGWIPYELASAPDRVRFRNAPGDVEIAGILRNGRPRAGLRPEDPLPVAGGPRVDAWHRVDLPKIGQQIPYPLLAAFVEEEAPASGEPRAFPKPQPDISLDEGSHLIFAVQWFAFAVIAVAGYAGVAFQRARRP
mgnify:CR=1 FL=1